MSDTIDLSSESNSSESEDEGGPSGPTPAKRRRVNSAPNLSFKEKIQNILENLSGAAPGEFAVSGKLNAPMTTIAIKVIFQTFRLLRRKFTN